MADKALIPVFTGELIEHTTQYCNARDLHASLQVRRDFSNWIKDRIGVFGFIEGQDFDVCSPNLASKRRGGQNRMDYRLTLDMAKELSMIENNEVGRAVRRYFIECETALRAELREKAKHVLPVRGVKLMRDGISMKDTLKLQEQSHKVMRMIVSSTSKAERQNLHYHLRQINLTLGVPTIDLEQIEAEIVGKEA